MKILLLWINKKEYLKKLNNPGTNFAVLEKKQIVQKINCKYVRNESSR